MPSLTVDVASNVSLRKLLPLSRSRGSEASAGKPGSSLASLTFFASTSSSASTLPSLSSTRLADEGWSGNSWLMHEDPRRMQPSQMAFEGAAKVHRILRRLHSQQLCVPFRTFLFLRSGSPSDISSVLVRLILTHCPSPGQAKRSTIGVEVKGRGGGDCCGSINGE